MSESHPRFHINIDPHLSQVLLVAQIVKVCPCGRPGSIAGREDPWKMAAISIYHLENPMNKEPGRLHSHGVVKIGP